MIKKRYNLMLWGISGIMKEKIVALPVQHIKRKNLIKVLNVTNCRRIIKRKTLKVIEVTEFELKW